MFFKIEVLKNFAKFTGKHLCQNQVASEFCKISKNTFFHRARLVAASELWKDLSTIRAWIFELIMRGVVLPDTFNENSVLYLQVPNYSLVPPMTNSFRLPKRYSIFSCRNECLKILFSPSINLIFSFEVLALKVCFVSNHSVHWLLFL